MDRKTKSWINAALLVATLIVNALGATGIINGLSQKEISDRYQTLITPAPSTFSIWSVIYTFLIISIVVLVIKAKDNYYGKVLDEISPLFWVSCTLNIVWIVTFSYELIGLSTIFIFAFLIVMVLIVKRLGRIQEKNRFLLPVAFGLYAGWLFIATVVNIAAWLVKIQWERFGISEEIWSIVILLVAVGLTLLVLLDTKNAILPLPLPGPISESIISWVHRKALTEPILCFRISPSLAWRSSSDWQRFSSTRTNTGSCRRVLKA